MKTIKILGTGCAKCRRTETIVREVVEEMGIDASVEKVDDIVKIMSYDILSTPAVVVDEKVEIRGRVPKKVEIRELLS